jgi:DNA-binding NtrC family response regulator
MDKPTILAVDDEADMLKTFENILKKKFNLLTAASGSAALSLLAAQPVDLVLLDIRMPKMDGLEALTKIKALRELEVVMVSASKDIASAVEAMKLGAFDYIAKPFDVKELLVVIDKALEKQSLVKENLYLKSALAQALPYCDLLGQTPAMRQVFETIATVAKSDSRVLVTGESGTGKELVARAIHRQSRRAEQPFVAVNCAAVPDNLLESELFGYERGAFTGALERKLGKFELADGGTVFLDEIGCMSPAMQAKLLRVIQDNVLDRIGGAAPVEVNVRIIAATNLDFKKAIADRTFREDLYYRLNVIPIHLPPLRERREDIPLFLEYFLAKYRRELNRPAEKFETEAVRLMKDYSWPGNVRELQNIVERLVTLSHRKIISRQEVESSLNYHGLHLVKGDGYAGTCADFERDFLRRTLVESKGNRTLAAKKLKLARTTFLSKLKNLGLN